MKDPTPTPHITAVPSYLNQLSPLREACTPPQLLPQPQLLTSPSHSSLPGLLSLPISIFRVPGNTITSTSLEHLPTASASSLESPHAGSRGPGLPRVRMMNESIVWMEQRVRDGAHE